jgi:hypothetical protein
MPNHGASAAPAVLRASPVCLKAGNHGLRERCRGRRLVIFNEEVRGPVDGFEHDSQMTLS